MTSCVWAYSDSPRLFPRLIAVGVSSLCFNLDTAPALVRHGSVNKRSHLASQMHAGLCETWKMSRCDGGISEINLLSVWLTGLDRTSNSTLLAEIILTGNTAPSDELWDVSSGLSFSCPLVRVGSWYRFSQAQSAERLEVKEINTFHFLPQRQYRPSGAASSVGTERLSAPR